MRVKLAELNALGLYESAEILGNFLISARGASACPPAQRSADLALFADALVGLGRVRRSYFTYYFFCIPCSYQC